jgi:hypothetical protein
LGEFSPNLVSVSFGQLLENYRTRIHFGATLFNGQVGALSLTKTDLATFWAIFAQTHLVTLSRID